MEEVHWVREYDSKTSKHIFKCNIRDCKCTKCDLLNIKIHVFRIHGKFNRDDLARWEADEDNLWQDFTKKELFLAECKTCATEIIVYRKASLSRHLQKCQWYTLVKEFMSTSLPQHFELDEKDKRFDCIHCNTCCSNVQRIDDLKNHLMSHKNECSGSSGSENENANATIQQQQFEHERNVPTTSSQYVNPQPVPGNEEGQERSTNINEQEAPEYESPLDDDMFWIRNFQL